ADMLLDEATRKADAPVETKPPAPGAPDTPEKSPAEVKAQVAVDTAKGRQEAAQQKLKLAQTRKELLDRVSAGIDACQSAAVAFLNALDDLKPYTIELGLRVKDGTLEAGKVPAAFSPDALEKKRKDLGAD